MVRFNAKNIIVTGVVLILAGLILPSVLHLSSGPIKMVSDSNSEPLRSSNLFFLIATKALRICIPAGIAFVVVGLCRRGSASKSSVDRGHTVSRILPRGYFTAALVLVLLCGLWSLIAAWLCAHLVITTHTEIISYYLCIVGVVFGVIICVTYSLWGNVARKNLFLTIAFSLFVLVITSVAWGFSDEIFSHWKMRAISGDAWQRMASELEALAKQSDVQDTSYFYPDPSSTMFAKLGRKDDCLGGSSWDHDGLIEARMVYGTRLRRWGLCVGSKDSLRSHWPNFHFITAGTNAYFFCGPDY
jgi:hypothetical protein